MNKDDRKQLSAILAAIENAKSELAAQQDLISELAESEREKFDNMSEGLQNGEKGQAISEAADALENAKDACDSAVQSAEECFDALNGIE